jgi:energy-coupling factor transporter ATP-binding protein EcfA2
MYITDVELTNLRSFKGTHKVSLAHDDGSYAGWTVFAGRNGSGKSSLLKAIALGVVGPLASRSLAGVFTGWVNAGEQAGTVAIRVTTHARDQFEEGVTRPAESFWVGLKWTSAQFGTWINQSSDLLDRWVGEDTTTSPVLADAGPWRDNAKGWFLAGYGPYRHLGPPPAEIEKFKGVPVLARLVNLFNETATLSDAVDWLQQIHVRSLEKREGADELKRTVLAILGHGLLPDGSKIIDVDSTGLRIERDGVALPLEVVSDGYRSVAALVVDILMRLYQTYRTLDISQDANGKTICNLPGVVMIDEVDAHMHVSWQQQIGFWLTTTFPAIQFLVTTHSPFICQAASPGGIFRLPAIGDPRKIEAVSHSGWAAVVNGGADDAVMTDLFGLEHAHSQSAEDLRQEMVELEVKALQDTATTIELDRYDALKSLLGDDLGAAADRKLRAVSGRHG